MLEFFAKLWYNKFDFDFLRMETDYGKDFS